MNIYQFSRIVRDSESVDIEAETLEEALEILNDPDSSFEFDAEPLDSGPWDDCTVREPGTGSWDATAVDMPEDPAAEVPRWVQCEKACHGLDLPADLPPGILADAVAVLREIRDVLADHPDLSRGNSKVGFCYHKAKGIADQFKQ